MILILYCLVLGCAPTIEKIEEAPPKTTPPSSLEAASSGKSQNLLVEDLFPETKEVVLSFNDDPKLIAPRTYASLTGILRDKGICVIIEINGKAFILQKGQSIKDFMVEEISNSWVLLVKASSGEAR